MSRLSEQSLADSDAELARDPDEKHEMIDAGKSDEQILDFLVARYGDFVLYRPPQCEHAFAMDRAFVVLLGALIATIISIRKRAREESTDADNLMKQSVSKLSAPRQTPERERMTVFWLGAAVMLVAGLGWVLPALWTQGLQRLSRGTNLRLRLTSSARQNSNKTLKMVLSTPSV